VPLRDSRLGRKHLAVEPSEAFSVGIAVHDGDDVSYRSDAASALVASARAARAAGP
jgi:hypothetical protein